jgi:hypothetical protein
MKSSRSTLRSFALLLALTGVLFRGMIPAGFMPAVGTDAQAGAILALCSGGMLKSVAVSADPDGHPAAQAMDECPFAAASSPALPPTLGNLLSLRAFTVERLATGEPSGIARRTAALPPARGPPRIA